MRIPILPTFQPFGSRGSWARRYFAVALWGGAGLSLFSVGSASARTPFMLENSEAPPAVAEQPIALELRGIVSTPSGYLFGLYDATNRQSTWVGLSETASAGGTGLIVRSHDLATDSISGEFQGRPFTLSLKTAKVDALLALPSPPPAVAVDQPSVNDVAKELERRRALRMAARLRPPAPPRAAQK